MVSNTTAYAVTQVNDTAGSGSSSVGYTAQCHVTELPERMGPLTTQTIVYEYEMAWNNNHTCLTTSSSLDTLTFSIEQWLNEYLSQELLQNCTFRQRYVQFYSISTWPLDRVLDPAVCISDLASLDHCYRVQGSLTVKTFYKSSRKRRRRMLPQATLRLPRHDESRLLNENIFEDTAFSDAVLAQKMGSLMVFFFSSTSPLSQLIDPSTVPQLQFSAITNFVSQDMPTWDAPSHSNATTKDENASPVFRGPWRIPQTWGWVVVAITAMALLLVSLGMLWHRRRQQRQRIRTTVRRTEHTAKSSSTSAPKDDDRTMPEAEVDMRPGFCIVGDDEDDDENDSLERVRSIRGVWDRKNSTPPIFISSTTAEDIGLD